MRIRSACVSVVMALGMTVLGVGTADATGPLSGTKIRNWQTGFVLGVAANSTAGGAQVHYQAESDHLAQKWAIDPVTSTTFMLRNLNSDMCITAVAGGDTESLQQRPCDSRWGEQIFSLEDSSKPSRYLLKNQTHGKCINAYNGSVNDISRVAACSAGSTYQAHSFDVR
ncbi:RICIN domain-containing protein [Streptomyces sp. NPDC051704]|uniref:RICIN domain-containing protein n=1 Tax=Streptomyces sp. NPDC051704 TaxID=3365671 RepID=UPI003788FBD3